MTMLLEKFASGNFPRGNTKAKARLLKGRARTSSAITQLNDLGVTVCTVAEGHDRFFEVIEDRHHRWDYLRGKANSALPKDDIGNGVIWRSDVWDYVSDDAITLYYPGEDNLTIPVVKLEHIASGLFVHVIAVHLPTKKAVRKQTRDAMRRKILNYAAGLHAKGEYVYVGGDWNDKRAWRYFRIFAKRGAFEGVDQGFVINGICLRTWVLRKHWKGTVSDHCGIVSALHFRTNPNENGDK